MNIQSPRLYPSLKITPAEPSVAKPMMPMRSSPMSVNQDFSPGLLADNPAHRVFSVNQNVSFTSILGLKQKFGDVIDISDDLKDFQTTEADKQAFKALSQQSAEEIQYTVASFLTSPDSVSPETARVLTFLNLDKQTKELAKTLDDSPRNAVLSALHDQLHDKPDRVETLIDSMISVCDSYLDPKYRRENPEEAKSEESFQALYDKKKDQLKNICLKPVLTALYGLEKEQYLKLNDPDTSTLTKTRIFMTEMCDKIV